MSNAESGNGISPWVWEVGAQLPVITSGCLLRGWRLTLLPQEAIPVVWCWMRNVPHRLLYLKTELLVGVVGMSRKCLTVGFKGCSLVYVVSYWLTFLVLYQRLPLVCSVYTFSIGAYFGFVWNYFVYNSNYILRVLCMLHSGILLEIKLANPD